MKKEKTFLQKVREWPLLLPVVALFLVMAVNIIYDAANGNNPFTFFMITLQNTTGNGTILYGRIIDILNRGSEAAILAIGMTLVVSSSAGTDISVGSVMALAASVCCVMLAGFGETSVTELRMPLIFGVIGGILIACVCGMFNGFLVAYLKIQPMVATLILFSAARAIGFLVNNNMIVYVRNDTFGKIGGFTGIVPTPIIIALVCVVLTALILKKTALGTYIQSVGINPKASRIAGLSSVAIIFMTYVICGFFAGVAGIVKASRITSADPNNVGLYMEMDAILAVALGGNSLGGGKFNLTGSIIGAYTIQAITTTLYALGVSTDQAPVFKAIIVIMIVAIQAPPVQAYFRKRRAAKLALQQEVA